MDGIAHARDPGPRLDINMYTQAHLAQDAPRLPLNLLDALRALEASPVMTTALGALLPAYLKLKTAQWNEYAAHLTAWETETTLDV
jgi:glutamine synthetase